ncbi:eukaryotic translation initiation factor 2c [Parelaphostrongylus tenuis]|uniref:Eukaryotic translation initiation factor 2c n=1 Tax=Parelaphostrongylus tenuis TaxID=148309 RepID=A0AAD5WHS9_PARTN|nr:eukaryotic translation initiation factor 2c [Parelaphostrongylus tenuis]
MDQLKTAMADLTVKTIAMPGKRPPGGRGTKTELLTNLTKLSLKANVPFYKYDVRMCVVYRKDGRENLKELTKQTKDDFPEQQRKASTVIVYKHLVKKHSDVFTKDGVLFYDRAAILFSAQAELKLGGVMKEFILPANVLSGLSSDADEIRVTIKKVTEKYQVTSNDVVKAVNVRDMERDRAILEVLNLAVSQEGYMETAKFVAYGTTAHYLFDHRAFGFSDNELPELTDGKYMGIGLSKSVKVLEGDGSRCTPFVVADVTKSAFHADEQNLLDKISRMSVFIDHRTGKSNFSVQNASRPNVMKEILQVIKGLYVTTLYGKNRTFPIGGIAAAANSLRFESADGKQCTVEQYYIKNYRIQLKYPGLFTVSERHNPHLYYPVELLCVASSQRVTQQQQTPGDVAVIIRASATLPQHRLSQTKVMKKALKITPGNVLLEKAGITVDNDFTKVVGRVLPPPTIIYGGSNKMKADGKWSWDRARFFQPANLTNWAVCATLTQNDVSRIKLKEYVTRIENTCQSHGMQVAPVSEIFYLKRQTYDGLKEFYAEQKKKNRKYLMFITSDSIQQHDLIKLLELQYQIVSQEIRANKVNDVMYKNQNQTLDNVVAKINEKLGGVNYNIMLGSGIDDNKWLSDKSVLFVGFEISNPPAISKMEIDRGATYKMPSVLGWGANCAENPQQFIGDYVYVEPRQSDMMGSKLGQLVTDIIKRHQMASSSNLRHIIFFFSGISEGQYSMICEAYVRAIHKGISSLSLGKEPYITALAVSKDHNERLYKSNISGKRSTEQNILSGTIVDTTIVSPVINEFYLNAHSAFQGTAKTPKYSLVADNSQISLDNIEGITYGLCYLHEIVSATVSVPVPLMVAERCAKRGHDVYLANLKVKHVQVNSVKEANEMLVNHGDLKKLRYNA